MHHITKRADGEVKEGLHLGFCCLVSNCQISYLGFTHLQIKQAKKKSPILQVIRCADNKSLHPCRLATPEEMS